MNSNLKNISPCNFRMAIVVGMVLLSALLPFIYMFNGQRMHHISAPNILIAYILSVSDAFEMENMHMAS